VEKQFVLARLKDPESARFEFAPQKRDAIPKGFASPTPILVWTSTVRVNAKNSFGGYAGFHTYHFAWQNGRIVAVAVPMVTSSGVIEGSWVYLGP
jgi:hypothetical protein